MGIDVNLRQKGLFKKKIDYSLIQEVADSLKLTITSSDSYFRSVPYNGTPLHETVLILYDNKLISRGFAIEINSNYYDCFLRQTYFCNDNDIRNFFEFISAFAKKLKINEYEKDEELLPLSDIPSRITKEIEFNRRNLITPLNEDKYPDTIYAAINPIWIEPYAIEALLQMDEENAMMYWSQYLHNKQNRDYYYAVPHFYKDNKDLIFGNFALTENCLTVFPIEAYIPYGVNLKSEDISYYQILLGSSSDNNKNIMIPFEDLWNYFPFDSLESYDRRHVFITLDSDTLNIILEKSRSS